MPRLFPTLAGFQFAWLPGEAIAALTLAAIAVPEQLATARLVGMPPMAGLVAFVAGSIGVAALGSNRFMSVGADSTIAPIMASALAALAASGTPEYGVLAATMALFIGAALALSGVFRLGWIADLLSVPVTTGFLAGISVHVIVGQLPTALGLDVPHGSVFEGLWAILQRAGDIHAAPLVICVGVLGAVIAAEKANPRIPGALVGMVASGLAVWAWDLTDKSVAVLGALPVAMPRPNLGVPDPAALAQIFPVALVVALVCMMQTAAVAQSFPSADGPGDDVSRDFGAVGFGSLLAILGGSFAVNSSPPRTAVVRESGGRTQLVSLLAAGAVIAVAVLAAGAFAYVPQAALSGVLLFVAIRIFRWTTMVRIARGGGWEIALVVVSACLVIFLSVPEGVTLSVILSLLHGVYIVARPECREFLRVPGTTVWRPELIAPEGERVPSVVVFGPGVPVYFLNARAIRERLSTILAERRDTRLVVIEGSGVLDLDFTGASALKDLVGELRKERIAVKAARLTAERAFSAMQQSGLAAELGPGAIVPSVEEAVRAWQASNGAPAAP
jgi:sulfate permease, SulP family